MTDEHGSDQPSGRVPGRQPDTRPPARRPPPPSESPGDRSRSVSAEISPHHIRLVPGQTDTASVSIRYHGNVVDELTLVLSGDTAAWTRVAPDSLNVYPDTDAEATIRFSPPRAPQPHAGLLELQLQISSASDPSSSVFEQASVEIEPFDNVVGEAAGTTQLANAREAALPIKVRNLGNRPAQVSLRASEPPDATVFLSAAVAALQPGEETTVWATIRPRKLISFGVPKVHPFTLFVSSDYSPPVTIDGRFEQLPRFGRLRIGLAGVLAVGLAAVGVAAVLAVLGNGGGGAQTTAPAVTPTQAARVSDTPGTATTAPLDTGSAAAPSTPAAPTTAAPSTGAPTTAPPSTDAPSTAPPASTEAPTTAAPTTPPPATTAGPPTPVPTISAAFLKNGAWSLNSIEFATIPFLGLGPEDVTQAGDGLTFSDGPTGLIAQWSLAAPSRSLTCRANYGPGNLLTVFDFDHDGPLFDPFGGAVPTVLCGTSSPFTVTTSTVPLLRFVSELRMTNAAGTTIVWRRTDSLIIPSIRPIPTFRFP